MSAKNHAAKATEDLKPQMEATKAHINGIHTELEGFVSAQMEELPYLKPYNRPETVSIFVTAMMISPVVALVLPLLLCLCASKTKEDARR